jgi:Ras-related protein Rab-28
VQVIFLCYDVTDPQSFSDTEDWLGLVKKAHIDNITGQKLKLPKLYLVGNKVDLIHLRKIDQRQHDKFQKENELDGGFTISAQSGENVLKVFYQVAAASAGIKLSDYELAFTEKCLTASVVQYQDEGRTEDADRIEREDMEAAAKARARMEKGGCNCVVM